MKNLKLKAIVWQVIAIVGLNISYITVIANEFEYMGFEYELNYTKLFVSILIMIIMLFLGLNINNEFLFTVWNIMFLYLFCGEMVFYQYNPLAKVTQPILVAFCLIFIFLISKINISFKKTKTIKNPDFIITTIGIVMFLPFLAYFKYINIKNLLFIDVYETRTLFRKVNIGINDYLLAPLSRIILPMLIIRKLEIKHYKKALLFFVMIVYLYLCGALKSVFIGLIALLVFYRGSYIKKALLFSQGIAFLTITGSLIAYLSGNLFLVDAFIRRVFFIPPYLENLYINYFTNNYTYLSHSPFGLNIVENKYNIEPLSLWFGEVVMGQPGLNANIGLLTEGYISFGIFGGIFFGILISLILLFFKMVNLDPKYFGILFVYIYYFNTSFLSTLLLTHGLFFLIIISYYFFREQDFGKVNIKSKRKNYV